MKKRHVAMARTVAKGHKHAKPAHAHHKGGATGHAHKHHKAAKHHAAGKKHKGTVHRGLALGDSVACCAAEALAASLRLSGVPVSDAGILDLYWRTADDPDTGAPILATLEAASEFGLAAVQLTSYCPADAESVAIGETKFQSFILGLDLPGPHTVLATPDGWWSWGQLYCPWCEFPDAVIEEAWAVTWPGRITPLESGREVMSYAS